MKRLLLISLMMLISHYYLKASTNNTSSSNDDFYVTTFANPSLIVESSSTTIFAYAMGNNDEEVSYEWSPTDGLEDPFSWRTDAAPNKTTTYTITATCGDNVATATLTVSVVEIPNNVIATVIDNDVYIKWDKVELAKSYVLFRDGVPVSTYIVDTSYLDKGLNNGTYCYTVLSARNALETPVSDKSCVDVDITDINDIIITGEILTFNIRQIKSVTIYDMMAHRIMYEEVNPNNPNIDISDMNPGAYIISVKTESGVITKKINIVK